MFTHCKPCAIAGTLALVFIGVIVTLAILNEPQQGVLNYTEFVATLQANNFTVTENGTVESDFLRGKKYLLFVNGEMMQVWEYNSERAAQRDVQTIGADGSSFDTWDGQILVSWVAPPHWYNNGRIIVLYNGDQEAVLAILESVVGEQFAPVELL